ncbi:AbrB/MazE/SpoVT family DNA-binding domain-containing protein [Sphingomonas adhaesiva]|uniref:AbrB/MazE/SpoVT family DNA-binding domain-containing protein n=1 Tax=Sphingomonas adhaesiva TaxID=28212 RepID=UPI003FA7BB84
MERWSVTVADDGSIRLPDDVLRDLGLSEGEDVTVEPAEGGFRLRPRTRGDVGSPV